MTAMINIDSPRFGTLQVEPSRVIEFPVGLAGFEDCKRFSLFHPEEEETGPRFFILQSLDDPAVAFHIADPALFGFNFDINLTDAEADLLQLDNPDDVVAVVILTKGGASEPVRANLNAPLILNLATRRGLQHVFSNLNYNLTTESAQASQGD
jgi:flagellar assembly factor FliW